MSESIRLRGTSEKFGPVSTSDEFVTWEIPDRESSGRMRQLLDSMGRASLVLDKTKYGGITLGKQAHAAFIEKDEFSSGRNESAHQVRFGQLVLNGQDVHEQPEFVAVKPFDDRGGLYREWAAHEYLNSLGDRQLGYINLGVHNDVHGVESIVSQYDHGVTTFDSSFWADDYESRALRPAVLQRHAVLGAEGLGFLHGAHIIHGDAQVKNLAADRLGFRIVDLESATILDDDALNSDEALTQTGKDLRVFIDSMKQVEENHQKVSDALASARMHERIARAYASGVYAGKHLAGNPMVPSFGKLNRDTIYHQLEKLHSRTNAA